MAYEGSAVTASPTPRAGVVRAVDRATSSVPATSPIVRRLVLAPSAGSTARTPLIAVDVDTLQGYEVDNFDGLGFSLGKVVKNVGSTVKKAVKDTGKAVGKAAVQTAHVTGSVVTSKVGKIAIGSALALTGVGIPAAAAIGAATQGVGTLIKPGGGGKAAVKAAAVGAVGGAGAAVVGKGIQKYAPNVTTASRKAFNKATPGDTFKTDATGAAINAPKRKLTAVIGPVKSAPTRGTPLKFSKVPDLVHGEAPTALPVLMATAEVAREGSAKRGGSATDSEKKKPGTSLIKRATSAVVRHAADVMPTSGDPAPSYAPPSTSTPSETPTPEKPQLAGIGGISPVMLLVGAGALAFVLMNRKRGR